jgi:hypothetical protein
MTQLVIPVSGLGAVISETPKAPRRVSSDTQGSAAAAVSPDTRKCSGIALNYVPTSEEDLKRCLAMAHLQRPALLASSCRCRRINNGTMARSQAQKFAPISDSRRSGSCTADLPGAEATHRKQRTSSAL